MASHFSLLIVLVVACFVSLISPVVSQTCSTQNILTTQKTPFQTCLDLPVLDSYLHYTYNATNSSLSIAFVATPARPSGWVAWAINPTGTGMAGSQAFVALRSGPGVAPVVKTYNISSYSTLVEGRLAFDFWDLRAEALTGNRVVIHTSVKVPAGEDSVNQVWQIGGNVTNGRIGIHPFTPSNLKSTAVLRFSGSDAPASAPGGGASTTPGQAGGPGNAGSMTTRVNFGRPASEMVRAVNKFKADFGGQFISLERVQPSSDHVPHRFCFTSLSSIYSLRLVIHCLHPLLELRERLQSHSMKSYRSRFQRIHDLCMDINGFFRADQQKQFPHLQQWLGAQRARFPAAMELDLTPKLPKQVFGGDGGSYFAWCPEELPMLKEGNIGAEKLALKQYGFAVPFPIFTHLAGRTSVWKALSPEVLQDGFKVDPEVEQLFRSKRTSDAIFFPPSK
ncbi:BnaA05g30230D [Brassica napus]|uniref:BnaA05g30230D protein n=1 Tax=Brassica napus TaxID=3708 RepID=A0A078HDN3_BRANA|nr:BnaA05g30230D [Brassica napus]